MDRYRLADPRIVSATYDESAALRRSAWNCGQLH
jgi:hypothetical protein